MLPENKVNLFVESCVKNLVSIGLSLDETKEAAHKFGLELSRYCAYRHVIEKSRDAMLNEFTGQS